MTTARQLFCLQRAAACQQAAAQAYARARQARDEPDPQRPYDYALWSDAARYRSRTAMSWLASYRNSVLVEQLVHDGVVTSLSGSPLRM